MKKIVYTRYDGGISIVSLAADTDAALVRALAKIPVDSLNPTVVEDTIIPTDRTFRNAWKAGIGVIEYDMPKCRDIWRNRMRVARAPKLAVLDAEYLRADERGDTAEKQRIAAEKKKLRDVTIDPRIEAAQTPEVLKLIWPSILI